MIRGAWIESCILLTQDPESFHCGVSTTTRRIGNAWVPPAREKRAGGGPRRTSTRATAARRGDPRGTKEPEESPCDPPAHRRRQRKRNRSERQAAAFGQPAAVRTSRRRRHPRDVDRLVDEALPVVQRAHARQTASCPRGAKARRQQERRARRDVEGGRPDTAT